MFHSRLATACTRAGQRATHDRQSGRPSPTIGDIAVQALFGRAPEYPQHARSFVAHYMMVHKPYLLEMLDEIESLSTNSTQSAGAYSSVRGAAIQTVHAAPVATPAAWPWVILTTVKPGYLNVLVGFSEYTTYISWVMQHHSNSVDIVPFKDWGRITPFRRTREALVVQMCCPTKGVLDLAAVKNGWAYLGWELGHTAECTAAAMGATEPPSMGAANPLAVTREQQHRRPPWRRRRRQQERLMQGRLRLTPAGRSQAPSSLALAGHSSWRKDQDLKRSASRMSSAVALHVGVWH